MPSLFKGPPKQPELPPIKPATPMPDPQAQDDAKRKKAAAAQQSGRASTFLSPMDSSSSDRFGG